MTDANKKTTTKGKGKGNRKPLNQVDGAEDAGDSDDDVMCNQLICMPTSKPMPSRAAVTTQNRFAALSSTPLPSAPTLGDFLAGS